MSRAGRTWLLAAVLGLVCAAPAAAATFSSTRPIDVPGCEGGDCSAQGPALPYPSTINVAGLPDGVSKARAVLSGLTHPAGDEVDVLLIGPGGEDTILMRQVCAGALASRTFVFDDAATASLPLSGPCPSGTYRPSSTPSNHALFPPNAPPPPYALAMSVFNGGPSNGTWRIFVVDTGPLNNGVISGGWSLELASGECAGNSAFEPAHVGTAGNDLITGTEGPDVILGLGGNDIIRGLAGNDVACGGPGKDKLNGGPGSDKLKGQAGKDTLKGQGGNDTCVGGAKTDRAKGCEKEKSV